MYTARGMLSFVQLLALFWWEREQGSLLSFLRAKHLENRGQKSVGQKTLSSAAKKKKSFFFFSFKVRPTHMAGTEKPANKSH